jgi:hypothetical protein
MKTSMICISLLLLSATAFAQSVPCTYKRKLRGMPTIKREFLATNVTVGTWNTGYSFVHYLDVKDGTTSYKIEATGLFRESLASLRVDQYHFAGRTPARNSVWLTENEIWAMEGVQGVRKTSITCNVRSLEWVIEDSINKWREFSSDQHITLFNVEGRGGR